MLLYCGIHLQVEGFLAVFIKKGNHFLFVFLLFVSYLKRRFLIFERWNQCSEQAAHKIFHTFYSKFGLKLSNMPKTVRNSSIFLSRVEWRWNGGKTVRLVQKTPFIKQLIA